MILAQVSKTRVAQVAGRGVALFLMVVLAVSCLIPFLWMVSVSLMTQFEAFQYPPRPVPSASQWDNYSNAMKALPFGRFFLNSVVMTVCIMVGQLFVISTGAYAFSRLKFPGRDGLFKFYLLFMMLPGVVTLIPGFLILHAMGWVDTFYALIVPSLGNIWGMFLLRQYMMTIPESVEDSARLDGASELTIYSRIILPLSKPALTTVTVFTFMGSWKAFQWPLIVTRSLKMRTVEIGVSMFSSQYSSNLPYQMAAATVVALPVLVAFFVAQRSMIEGIDLTGGQR